MNLTSLKDDTVDEALQDLFNLMLPDEYVVAIIVNNFDSIYVSYYQDKAKELNLGHYKSKIDMVVDRLNKEVEDYEFIKPIIAKLFRKNLEATKDNVPTIFELV